MQHVDNTKTDSMAGLSRKYGVNPVKSKSNAMIILNWNNKILNSINKIYSKPTECETIEELALACLDVALELTQSSCGFIDGFNCDKALKLMAIRYEKGSGIISAENKFSLKSALSIPGDNFIRKLLLQGKSFLYNNAKDMGIPEGHIAIKNFMGVPLMYNNESIGFIVVSNKAGKYSIRDQKSLEAVSSSIAQVILSKHTEFLLKQAKEEKQQALNRANEMKDEFLSIISHEFKTPLTVINSAIQAMETICRQELTPKAKWFLKKIKLNSYRQLRLINNLLDVTSANADSIKVNTVNKDIVLLTREIAETVQTFANHKGIALTFESEIESLIIGTDEEKYNRIILNLLSNAIKFTPQGKAIHVRLYVRKPSHRDMVCIDVEDEGVGIPKEMQELIFEKFGQVDKSLARNAEGTGLGLFLARLLASALNGSITLQSKTGRGSIFTLHLPASKAKPCKNSQVIGALSCKSLVRTIEMEFSDIYIN